MIPAKHHHGWRQLLLQDHQQPFNFLALKLLMSRLRMRLKADKSPSTVQACVDELHAFAVKHERFAEAELSPLFR
jgi:hypothetical protein